MLAYVVGCLLALSGGEEMAKKPASPTPAERRQRRAKRTYRKVWRRMDDLYGAEGKAAPLVKFHRKGNPRPPGTDSAYVRKNEDNVRYVGLAPRYARLLAGRKPKAIRKAKDKQDKRIARREWKLDKKGVRKTLLHEWAHIYQDPTTPNMILHHEGAADLFATEAAKKRIKGLKRRKGKGRRPYRPSPSYPEERREVREKFDPSYWRRDQFGYLWGSNPRKSQYREQP